MKYLRTHIDWWRIVDLPEVADYGSENLADGKLAFFPSIDKALADESPDVAICSHTL